VNPAAIETSIRKLDRQIEVLRNFNPRTIVYTRSPEAMALQAGIEATLDDIFGRNTSERRRYSFRVESSQARSRALIGFQLHQALDQGQQTGLALLAEARRWLAEKFEESRADDSANRAIRAYDDLDLHPEIGRAASKLYRDGHYANAIVDSVIALNGLVRMRSGVELDGTALMERVFAPRGPILQFNDLTDESDQNEQKGFMMMFSGAVAGLRNPRAHKLIKDHPERALEFIAFVSLLAKLLDGAKKASPKP
jgi:uncharacterized protein (TIGR02391 family)